jgi:hypothetical protein
MIDAHKLPEVKEARKNFERAARAYADVLKASKDQDSYNYDFGHSLEGFIDGWCWKPCKHSYDENEAYNEGYGQGENHLHP